MKLEQAERLVGASVVYIPSRQFPPLQSGVITSVNDTFVFVRYGTNGTSAATRPEDLELEVRP